MLGQLVVPTRDERVVAGNDTARKKELDHVNRADRRLAGAGSPLNYLDHIAPIMPNAGISRQGEC